jgi:hypothetical protein
MRFLLFLQFFVFKEVNHKEHQEKSKKKAVRNEFSILQKLKIRDYPLNQRVPRSY